MHEIENDVEDPAIAPTKYCMKQGANNVIIEDPDPPLTIFHKVYDLHDGMERNMYTDQTGNFRSNGTEVCGILWFYMKWIQMAY